MAWVDDRIWCHPKFADLSAEAFRLYVHGVAYSTGFGCAGYLTAGQQKTVGATARVRSELVKAGLWDVEGEGVYIHDWHHHNGKRDARRAADRERKREARGARPSTGTSAGRSAGLSTLSARVDGSEGSDGSENHRSYPSNVVTSPAFALNMGEDYLTPFDKLVAACGNEHDTLLKLKRASKGCAEGDIVHALEAASGPRVEDPLAVALSELKKRRTA